MTQEQFKFSDIQVPAEVQEWADDLCAVATRLHAVATGAPDAHPADVALFETFKDSVGKLREAAAAVVKA